ncbi:SIN3-HDAC complex-associated factor [Euwallacea similis]|uniref:SIN3-HDAC complex-associated factor n=1 Tax=Euwallacea similis TaxID=1736056 RepID=UPI00344F3F3E
MFSFHRPKVYRSSTGCCICKAKSSSSRFTDSKKYEEDFMECFKLATPRQGEICNACVLLVKRWKKLPAGSDRNWRHVVDARAGPGMKSFTKFKTRNRKLNGDKLNDKMKKKQFEREYSPPLSDKSDGPEDMDINDVDFLSEDGPSMGSSRNGSPGISDVEDHVEVSKDRSRRRKGKSRRRDEIHFNVSGFIDLDYWKKETICCGTIYRGQNDEIMVDHSSLKPCSGRIAKAKATAANRPVSTTVPVASSVTTIITATPTPKTPFSDSSSDSGYDDCSNQGIALSPDAQMSRNLENREAEARKGDVADLMCHETIFESQEVSDIVTGHYQAVAAVGN